MHSCSVKWRAFPFLCICILYLCWVGGTRSCNTESRWRRPPVAFLSSSMCEHGLSVYLGLQPTTCSFVVVFVFVVAFSIVFAFVFVFIILHVWTKSLSQSFLASSNILLNSVFVIIMFVFNSSKWSKAVISHLMQISQLHCCSIFLSEKIIKWSSDSQFLY